MNEGAQILKRKNLLQSEIARKCGVSQGRVSQWLSGQTKPSLENRFTLQAKFDIPLESWDRELTATGRKAA